MNAAVIFDSKDAAVEAIGIYSRRVTEVFAHKPTAGDKLNLDYGIQRAK